jgi:hypothetical protein
MRQGAARLPPSSLSHLEEAEGSREKGHDSGKSTQDSWRPSAFFSPDFYAAEEPCETAEPGGHGGGTRRVSRSGDGPLGDRGARHGAGEAGESVLADFCRRRRPGASVVHGEPSPASGAGCEGRRAEDVSLTLFLMYQRLDVPVNP